MTSAEEPLLRTRENTRARLVAAGRRLFYARDYSAISVDLIAREAGFTRAAFYLHFTGKDDLLAAMMIAESRLTDDFFRWFEREAPAAASIEDFIRAFLLSNRESPASRLFHLAALQSESARVAMQENRLRLMTVLAAGFPAFLPARSDGVTERRRAAEAIFAILQLEQLGLRQAELADPGLIEAMIAALTDHFAELHRRYPGD